MEYDTRKMTMSQLVEQYNKLVPDNKRVRRFESLEVGRKRLNTVAAAVVAKKPRSPQIKGRPRGLNLAVSPNGVIPPRAGTLRRRVFDMVARGTTLQEVQELMAEFDRERNVPSKNLKGRAYKNVRMLHFYAGYGLRTDDEGRVHLVQ